MSAPQRHRRISELFLAAHDLPAAERVAFLDRECRGDGSLRRAVEELLAQDSAVGVLSDARIAAIAAAREPPAVDDEGEVGRSIGPYKLLQRIGEGGFGSVFMAEQSQPMQRRVALKLVKLGMDTKQVIARFEAERQALALMDHPNIARVLDAGTTARGRPYFVMELVKGESITSYCDRHGLDLQGRLGLFIDVCRAVEHAHQKGVIHRDLKPSNIMVTLHDGRPVPKVIDFGIAKATDRRLTEQTLFTEYGQLIGTPEYMSPEQAEMSGLDIDIRTDVYSLGVLLYELLTGMKPIERSHLLSAGHNEIQRVIREEEPARPSTRVSQRSLERARKIDDLSVVDIARLRHTDPSSLARFLRGDLDCIVMRCLEKDRTRRYDGVGYLAADVRSYLAHEPVSAGPPSSAYRLRKFVRRHWRACATATVLGLAVVGGAIGTSIGMVRAWRESERADANARAARDSEVDAHRAATVAKKERAVAEAVAAFLNEDLLAAVRPERLGRDVLLRDVLDEAAARLDDRFEQPLVAAKLHDTIAASYYKLGVAEAAERHTTAALELYERSLGRAHPSTLWQIYRLALYAEERGDLARAEELCREALTGLTKALGATRRETLGAQDLLRTIRTGRGDHASSERLARKSLEIWRSTYGPRDQGTLRAINNLAHLLNNLGRHAEAAPLFREAYEGFRDTLGADDPMTLTLLHNLGSVERDLGHYEAAERDFEMALAAEERKFGPEHHQTRVTMHAIAWLYALTEQWSEAEAMMNRVIEIASRKLAPDHPDLLSYRQRLSLIYLNTAQYDAAQKLCEDLLETNRRKFGPHGEGTLGVLDNLGLVHLLAGRLDEAEPILTEALALEREYLPPGHPYVLDAMRNLAMLYEKTDREEAAKELRQELAELTVR